MEPKDSGSTKALHLVIVSIFFLLFSWFLAKRRLRLSAIPGPFLASFTDFWRIYYQNFYSFTSVLAGLHLKYGTFVRIGPNTVSISDARAVSTIYSTHGDFQKADSYQPLRSVINGEIKGSVIDLQDEAIVTQIKRAVGNVFSEKNVLDYESDVDEVCDQLLHAIHNSPVVDLFAILGRFQADFLSQIAFGERPQHLERGASSDYLSFRSRFAHWVRWQGMPYLEHVICKAPILMGVFKAKGPPAWARMASLKLQARSLEDGSATLVAEKRDLLSKYIAGGEKRGDKLSAEAIPRMVSSTISAGFDTTAFTMTAVLYFLRRAPETATKLRNELNGANLSTRPLFRETQHLPYLNAVIKEAMRLYPFLQLVLERIVPPGGSTICGKHFPSGTVVGCNPVIVQSDPMFYGTDANEFRPERWLIEDRVQLLAMERSQLGFGNGKRICIGRHLAEMEMKKVIPLLLAAFDYEFVDNGYTLTPDDIFTSFPKPLWVTFVAR